MDTMRPLTYPEMILTCRMAYIETADGSIEGWYAFCRETHGRITTVHLYNTNNEFHSVQAADYYREWRAWPHKPTDAQRKAAPWS